MKFYRERDQRNIDVLARVTIIAVKKYPDQNDQNAKSFGHMPRNGIAGSYGTFTFSFLRILHMDFQSGHTSLHFHQ